MATPPRSTGSARRGTARYDWLLTRRARPARRSGVRRPRQASWVARRQADRRWAGRAAGQSGAPPRLSGPTAVCLGRDLPTHCRVHELLAYSRRRATPRQVAAPVRDAIHLPDTDRDERRWLSSPLQLCESLPSTPSESPVRSLRVSRPFPQSHPSVPSEPPVHSLRATRPLPQSHPSALSEPVARSSGASRSRCGALGACSASERRLMWQLI